MFFLKTDKSKKARVWAKLKNGFVGLAGDSIKQAQPEEWAKFEDRLGKFGLKKAERECEAKGEFHLPAESRNLGVIERELGETAEKLEELKEEFKKAKAVSPKKAPKPSKDDVVVEDDDEGAKDEKSA